jgi:hypothetical protein
MNWKKVLPFCIAATALLHACNNESTGTKQTVKSVTATAAAKPRYEPVVTWLNDFRNFRTAVYQNDIDKQKTYFSFPLNADTTQIWEAVYELVDDRKRPATLPATFTEADFVKHQHTIFTQAFIKSLLKVKSDELFKKGEYTTPEIKDDKESYSMVANYDKAAATLQLTVTYLGGTDEEGNYVSEGEHATIYFFKIEDNKYLKFDKVLFAG